MIYGATLQTYYIWLKTPVSGKPFSRAAAKLWLWSRHFQQIMTTLWPWSISMMGHLKAHPVPQGQTVLITRRWLSRKEGELPSATQGAFWLDYKRLYMAFKPSMLRIYLVIKQPSAYQEVMQVLGFKEATNTYVEIEATGYHCMANDMGPRSVDGWLTGLAQRELGVEQRFSLQIESRQLLVDEQILDLTPLEFGVAQCLLARPGRTVSRAHLLQQVWLTQYQGGSNVVDAVVPTLRKKLGPYASAIATVTGVGYRLNLDEGYTPGNNINEP